MQLYKIEEPYELKPGGNPQQLDSGIWVPADVVSLGLPRLRCHVWCPGNGTRYTVLFAVDPDGYVMLVWEGRGKVMKFLPDRQDVLSYTYVMEKLDENERTVAGLLGLIDHLGLKEVIYPEGYEFPGVRTEEVREDLVMQVRPRAQ